MELSNYVRLEGPLVVSRTDIGIVARVNDAGEPVQVYEIMLAKKDSIIVRIKGAHKASAPKKLDMPAAWSPDGHTVGGEKFQFLKKKDVVVGPKSGKIKRVGKKSEGPTKLDKCRQIWKDNPNLSRKDMIAKFVSEGTCTDQGANTYYLLIKKENE